VLPPKIQGFAAEQNGDKMKKPEIYYSKKPVIEPKPGCSWADTMVLNPAIVKDAASDTLHMLFRATGPWPQKNLKGKSDPYPIFLGYARSEDAGETWEADFERPALMPRLAYEMEDMYVLDDQGKRVVNCANGCIEDPRIFEIEGELYLTTACRMFPPGPYWEGDRRRDNLPDWVQREDNPFGTTASRNDTTTVLFKLDLEELKNKEYDKAFQYVCTLTDGNVSDNRDVFFFPHKMKINGRLQYVMLHRPDDPDKFPTGEGIHKPSMFLAAAEELRDFVTDRATHQLLAVGEFDWEEERIGASFPPISLGDGEWLVSYHGKQLPDYGYTQSFMIVREQENAFPKIINRCSERLIYAKQDWELPDKFLCPCIFTTGGIVAGDELIMSYGAADQKIGIARSDFKELVAYIRSFDAHGKRGSGMEREMKEHLRTVILPYWKRLFDSEQGGYYGRVDFGLNILTQADKGVILNSRILWFFSNAYLSLKEEGLLAYARHAYEFLIERCLDREFGGVYWMMSYDGSVREDMKHTYNQAFAIYALCAYYEASGEEKALSLALEIYHLIERNCVDAYGYLEAFTRKWEPISNEKLSENGLLADKTMNTLLHVLEAYTQLYRVSGEAGVKERLIRILDIFCRKVYNSEKKRLEVFFDERMESIADMHSYGHDIEASWLLDEACRTIGDEALCRTTEAYTEELAKTILNTAMEGDAVLNECFKGEINKTRVWWVQAEAVVGFYNAYEKTKDPLYLKASRRVWCYIGKYFLDSRENSEWYWDLDESNYPMSKKPITEPWKCPYHNGRMCFEIMRRSKDV
jgi:mannose/cellobiose epimerase-like protein (N-acyl-D-glucosamine 2-epimerase family)/predicted GH43/DUF377 family glycosyl hydrolase